MVGWWHNISLTSVVAYFKKGDDDDDKHLNKASERVKKKQMETTCCQLRERIAATNYLNDDSLKLFSLFFLSFFLSLAVLVHGNQEKL